MKYTKIFGRLALAIMLALLIVVIPATPASAAIIIKISPEKGKIGDELIITGSGFTASFVHCQNCGTKKEPS